MAFCEMAGLENTLTVLPQSKDVQTFKLKPNQLLSYSVQTLSWLGAVECPCHGHVLAPVHHIALHQLCDFDPLCSRGPEHELLSSSDPSNQENTFGEVLRIRI